jgi:hypothetical protein
MNLKPERLPNIAYAGQVRAFRGFSPNGGFGVWQFFPSIPAPAGSACRWLGFVAFKHMDALRILI